MTERLHLPNVLIIRPIPCLNQAVPARRSFPVPHACLALDNDLSSSDKSEHGTEAVGQESHRKACHSLMVVVTQLL
jgi:hypothetical protein